MMRSHQHITHQKAKHDPSIVHTRGRLNKRSLNLGQGFWGGGGEESGGNCWAGGGSWLAASMRLLGC